MVPRRYNECFAIFFASLSLLSCFSPAVAFRFEGQDQIERAFNTKPNSVKKVQLPSKETKAEIKPASILKEKKEKEGFQWGSLLNVALNLLPLARPSYGTATLLDKTENVSPLTSGEFSWTKIISLGLQLILSFFGNDNVALDKMDPGSPLEAFLTAIIAYFTGSKDAQEVSVMAKQATELWGIVISLLDTLRTSFSQRSLEARAIGSNDVTADVAIASTALLKSYIQSYNNEDETCVQKYICEANRDCANEASDSGYLYCQMATYALSYLLEGTANAPMEVLNDAGRRGRIGDDCDQIFKACDHTNSPRYF